MKDTIFWKINIKVIGTSKKKKTNNNNIYIIVNNL